MQFGILGPLEVRDGRGRGLPLRGSRQGALLALLLLHANERVSTERLIDGLWSGGKPPTALNALQVHVSNLRKALDGSNQILVTEPGGYKLDINAEDIDARRFETLVVEGRLALDRSEHEQASATLAEGLRLWRGRALADFLDEPFAQPEIARLEDLRLAAIEDRVEADLALRREAEVVPELEALVAAHPTRERLRGQLMLALYRTGRQAEALEQFQHARRVLVGDLGLEPSVGLKALQSAILRQDSSLASGSPEQLVPGAQRSERRSVTALFITFAAVGSKRDPEATARAIARLIQDAQQIVERHGGHVLEAGGDRVLAVFGVPRACEDDALRALRAAVTLRDLGESGQIATGIGLEAGAALVRLPLGERDGVAGNVLGDVARLGYAARPGEILLGETTRALAGHALRASPARRLEGLGPVWRLRELLADAPAIPLRATTPFVNREDELEQLLRAYSHACAEGTSHLVTVLGPAGIGKSRLAAEFRLRVASEASVLVGRCLPYGHGMTFWPLAEIVEQAAGERASSALAKQLAGEEQAGTIAEQIASALGSGEGARGEETFWAVRRFLEGLARTRPVVVLFEDLHWAEPTFLDLIDHVADFARSEPLLLVCLARPELLDRRPAWGGGKANATSMLLEPLSEDESAALVENIVEEGPLEAESRARIVEAAGGNPLFIEELVRVNLESGARPRQLALPPTIQAVLAARLDQLEPAERTVLEAASIVGREFWLGALAELAGESAGVDFSEHLRTLVRKDLIRPHSGGLGDQEAFRFRHLLIRDAAYEAIPKERRAELHEQFADWLARTAANRLSKVEEILGFHLEQAFRYRSEILDVDAAALDLAARAAGHLAVAGGRAHAREDTAAEISLLSRATKLLPAEDRRRLELLPALGAALREVGDFAGAKAVLGEASALAGGGREQAIAACARVIQLRLELQTDSRVSLERIERDAATAVRQLEQWGDDRWLAMAWELLAWLPYFGCRAAEAEEALQRMVECAKRAGDARQEGRALALLFATAVFGPLRVQDGIRRCEEVLSRHPASQRMSASAMRALASLKAMSGDFEEARELIAREREISEDLGQPLISAKASIAYGFVELGADDAPAAERELRAGYEQLKELGEGGALCNVAAVLAQAVYLQGRDGEALELTTVAERAAAPEDLSAQVYWRGPRAMVLARRRQLAEAEELAREAVVLARKTDFLNMQGDALTSSAEVLRVGDQPDAAAAELRKAIHAYDRKGNRVASRKSRRVLAELLG